MGNYLLSFFRTPAKQHWLIASFLLFLLYSPALLWDLALDDHLHHTASVAEESPLVMRPPFLLFTFANGNPADVKRLMDTGYLPWWTHPQLKMHFFRPLSAFSLWLDYKLHLPVWLMHLHSFLWYGFLLWGLASLYRLLFSNKREYGGLAVAGPIFLAWFLFALDDAHSIPLSWLAHRYSIISLTFGVWMIRAHERYYRREGPVWAGPLFFLLGLLGGETVLTTLGYLFLRSLRRFSTFLPYAVITVAYLIFYKLAGFGSLASGSYVNPLHDPLKFAFVALERWPALVGSQIGLITTDLWLSLPTTSWIRPAITLAGVALLGIAYRVMRPFREEEVWLGGGALLSLLPVCAMFPHDRLLMVAGIGFFPILARYLFQAKRGVFWWFMVVTHLVLAVVLLPAKIQFLGSVNDWTLNTVRQTPLPDAGAPRKTVVVNAPSHSLGVSLPTLADTVSWEGAEEGYLVLSQARADLTLRRVDEHTLEVETEYMNYQLEGNFRSPDHPFQAGDRVSLRDVTVHILRVNEKGDPRQVRFVFHEDPGLWHWLYWREDRFHVMKLPEPGESVTFPKEEKYPYI